MFAGFGVDSSEEPEDEDRRFKPIWPELRRRDQTVGPMAQVMFILLMLLVGASAAAILFRAEMSRFL
jgi:hypothetical protein